MTSKAVAEKEATDISTNVTDFDDFAGAGMEEAKADDYAIPFVGIIQSLSPQRKKQDSAYIEGVEEGNIFNSVTSEFWEEGVQVVPVYYSRALVEWNKREEGGGLVAIHPVDTEIPVVRDDRNRDITENGTQIVNTASFYCLIIRDDAPPEPVVINMASTQLKKARRWMTIIREQVLPSGKKAPMFANVYTLTTAEESNAQGEWFGWVVAKERPLDLSDARDKSMAELAIEFYKMTSSGEVKGQMEDVNASAHSAVDDNDAEAF